MYNLPQEDLKQIFNTVKEFWPQNKTILLAGGTGFFGRWLTETISFVETELKNRNAFILTSRQEPASLIQKIPCLKNSFFKLIETDLGNHFRIDEPLNYVIHAASDVSAIKRDSPIDYQNVIDITQNVIHAVSPYSLDKFLYISSGGVYPELIKPAIESDLNLVIEKNINTYAVAKRQSEILVNQLSSGCSARCFTFVGPFCDENMAVMQMLHQESFELRSPETVRSFMYPTDLVISLFKLLFLPNRFQVYNLGSDQPISLLELAHMISKNVKVAMIQESETKALAGKYYCPNTQRLDQEYGRSLTVNLAEALMRTRHFLKIERKAI